MVPYIDIPGLPEGLEALRYGTIEFATERILLVDGRLTAAGGCKVMRGLVVQVKPGFHETYDPGTDRTSVLPDPGVPRMIKGCFLVVDENQEASIRERLERMGAHIE